MRGRPKGTPKTGGRKKGSPNQRTRELTARIEASGMTPLDFMIAVMRSPEAPLALRCEMARQAAPFVHAKLATIAHTGADRGPMVMEEHITDEQRAKALAVFLARHKLQQAKESSDERPN
jgi:hypothetical protein